MHSGFFVAYCSDMPNAAFEEDGFNRIFRFSFCLI